MKNRRPSSHPQLTQTRLSLQATIGSFNTAARFVPFSENVRILIAPSAGTPSLFGRMIKLVLSPNLFNGTLLKKFTWATSRFGQHRFGFTGCIVLFG